MHGSLGFMVSNHPTPRVEPEDKVGYCKSAANLNMEMLLKLVNLNKFGMFPEVYLTERAESGHDTSVSHH